MALGAPSTRRSARDSTIGASWSASPVGFDSRRLHDCTAAAITADPLQRLAELESAAAHRDQRSLIVADSLPPSALTIC
jgi:hypothetical protein